MPKRTRWIIFLLVVSLVLPACMCPLVSWAREMRMRVNPPEIFVPQEDQPSKVVVTEERPVEPFNKIEFNGGGEIVLVHGSQYGLVIETEESMLKEITSTVRGEALVIDYNPEFWRTLSYPKIKLTISYPQLSEIDINGGVLLTSADLGVKDLKVSIFGGGKAEVAIYEAENLNVRLDGGSSFEIVGSVRTQTIRMDGTGAYKAGGLKSDDVVATLNGAGSIEVWAVKTLEATLYGVGRIGYYGDPHVTPIIGGLGVIEKIGDK